MATHARSAPVSGGFITGAMRQLLNELMHRVPSPTGPSAPPGDLFELRGSRQRAGADAVERLIDQVAGRRDVDPQAARAARALLARVRVVSEGPHTTTRLVVDAVAPGADWLVPGKESAMVAVYVDGRYHSTMVVHGEHRRPTSINLGPLPAGAHSVEFRAATDIAPLPARVRSVRSQVVRGEAALIDSLAPIIELRDTDPGAGVSTASSDVPLLVIPAMCRNEDGSRTIEYRVIFSNEEGGTHTKQLFTKFGRSVDVEPMYRVTIERDGSIRHAEYQSPLHVWMPYDGQFEAGRPVLRVSTANNLVSARTGSGRVADRWSNAPIAPQDPATTEFAIMRQHTWTWKVMAKELLREGKAVLDGVMRGADQLADPRRYLYLGPITDALRAEVLAAGSIDVLLKDRSRVRARVEVDFARGEFSQAAVELPPGILADAVRGVALIGVDALVLGSDFAPRLLEAATRSAAA